ncbi:hypothetical protein FOQG_17984 [Fusarium oxysporum f. sp. raphani 54005]|uniref:Uncharacterized protein n=1 Tax=Fusarium oxysporum f. sp. raphani 54005 TaxID=1089458 RepID=X0BFR3_FUSOX|nr:hypothetical protein FOQG_17984 [Fusarium oxysporum f. sp. raphani 54005]
MGELIRRPACILPSGAQFEPTSNSRRTRDDADSFVLLRTTPWGSR